MEVIGIFEEGPPVELRSNFEPLLSNSGKLASMRYHQRSVRAMNLRRRGLKSVVLALRSVLEITLGNGEKGTHFLQVRKEVFKRPSLGAILRFPVVVVGCSGTRVHGH